MAKPKHWINNTQSILVSWHRLLLVFTSIFLALFLGLSGLSLLPPNTARTATTEGTRQGEVDVLLAVQSDDEAGDVDNLLADTDMSLSDQDTGVMDRLGKTELVDASLQTAFQEIFDLQGEHVIELHAGFVEHTDTHKSANQGIAFEKTLGVLFVESEELTIQQKSAPRSECTS
jgi:hypothetical protein